MAENENTPQVTKDISQLTSLSVQYDNSNDVYIGSINWLSGFAQAGQLAPPWWSTRRDKYLFDFALRSNLFISAQYKINAKLCAIAPRVLPRNPNIKLHQELAAEYQQRLIEGSDFGKGWKSLFSKTLFDYFTQDNGAFIEVLGDGPKDGPIKGPALGMAALDSSLCTRTGHWEYPVVYEDRSGKYKLHWTRVIAIANNPTSRANMHDVGICWLSRCLDIAQNLLDMVIYKQEKLGSRPMRQLLIGQGISGTQIAQAIKMAENTMDNQGLNVFAKSVVLGSNNTDIDVLVKDLISLPDGFDYESEVALGMFAIALAIGVPPRDLWPSTTTGATKADAMYQHVGGGAGYATILDDFIIPIGGNAQTPTSLYSRFLPASLKLVFDYVDDTQDEASAAIAKTRSETRERDLNNGVITVRVARQQMLEDGELTEQQFDSLELSAGRLSDGTPVLRLFNTTDEFTLDLLNVGVSEPLNIELNAPNREAIQDAISERLRYAEIVVVNSSRDSQRQKAEQAIAALLELRKLYDSELSDNQEVEDAIEDAEESADDTAQKEQTFKPPASVAREAQRVLDWEEEHGDEVGGGTLVGKRRAQQLANREPVSLNTIKRMYQFFSRHEGNQAVAPEYRDTPWKDDGLVGWLRWGGDSGKAWSTEIWQANKNKQVGGSDDMPPEVDDYEEEIIGLIEQANNGEITEEEFAQQLEEITVAFITLVFLAGVGLFGEEDLSDTQAEALGEEIAVGTSTIDDLTREVYAGAFIPVEDGGQGHNITARATLWAVFLASVYELAKLYDERSDPYMRWNVTPGKDSCTDCLRLNGQVHRRSAWLASGWRPKRRNLECKGYNCGCYFTEARGPARGNF